MWGFLGMEFFIFFFVLGEIDLESLREFPPREHDPPPAAFAFEPDIRAETRDRPFVGAARVRFAQPQVIVEAEVGEHGWKERMKDKG